MRRAFFEWGAIGGVTLSILLFVYWVFSIRTWAANFELTWWVAEGGLQASARDGMLMLSNPGTGEETIEVIETGVLFTPAPTARHFLVLPGLRMGYMRFAGGSIDWYLHFPLLIPAALLMVVGVFCGSQYW